MTEIAERTGIALRRLRYVLEQGLLPGGKRASRGRGAARHFTPFEIFGIACAAWMLESGLRRALVRDCLELLCRPRQPGSRDIREVPLFHAFSAPEVAQLEVGDWVNVRLRGETCRAGRLFDTGWRQVATGWQRACERPRFRAARGPHPWA